MVVVTINPDHVVVHTITVDYDAPTLGNLAYQLDQIERAAVMEVQQPLQDKDNSIDRLHVERIGQQRWYTLGPVNHYLMTHGLCRPGITIDVLSTTHILADVIDEHQPHELKVPHVNYTIQARLTPVRCYCVLKNLSPLML